MVDDGFELDQRVRIVRHPMLTGLTARYVGTTLGGRAAVRLDCDAQLITLKCDALEPVDPERPPPAER